MASITGWGGIPLLTPSNTALKYLHHTRVIPKEDVRIGASWRARKDMELSVRGYLAVKRGIRRRLTDLERIKQQQYHHEPQISTSGVSPSKLVEPGHEHWAPMDPIFYHEKSCCFRNTLTRCPLFKRKIEIGWTEPRHEETIGLMDIRRKMAKNPSGRL